MIQPIDIRITGVRLKDNLLINLDPKTGEALSIHQMGQTPVITVAGLGDIAVSPWFAKGCLEIHEVIQKLPQQKLISEKLEG